LIKALSLSKFRH